MWKKMNNANSELHIFSNSGHGFLYQHAGSFTALVNEFRDRA
jgi:pimeloyl-ACP methyl ester carboxylesterase